MSYDASVKKFSTEFGDDIILKFIVPDAKIAGSTVEFNIGRMETIRYEDSEELKEARGIGSKFRIDSRTTRFRGILRCTLKPTAINMGIIQYALGAFVSSGEEITPENSSLIIDGLFSGDDTIPFILSDTKYFVPYSFKIQIRNVRTGYMDELYNVKFTRRVKEVREGEFTIMELEGEYDYSLMSSDIVNNETYTGT